MKTALWWLAGVFTAVLVMVLLDMAGVYEPIAMGLGFGVFNTVFLRAHMRLMEARYGVEILFLPSLLWLLLGCVAVIAVTHVLELGVWKGFDLARESP